MHDLNIQKNVHIDKLDIVVNKYNDTYHGPINMKPVDAKASIYTEMIKKVLNLKLTIMLEYQNIKMFLEKAMFQIGLKRLL